jgi:hypothetical protein
MILPPSSNAHYAGSKWAAWFLVLSGFFELVPGCIHYFLPDGGAGVIAGLDLSHDRATILGAFAWMGSLQIPFGIALIVVGLKYRALVPLFLLLNLMERGLMALAGWVLRPSPGGHHPPEHYGSVVAVLLLGYFLFLSLRRPR